MIPTQVTKFMRADTHGASVGVLEPLACLHCNEMQLPLYCLPRERGSHEGRDFALLITYP